MLACAERAAIEKHLATGSLASPSTRKKMSSAVVYPNLTLKVCRLLHHSCYTEGPYIYTLSRGI
jgi:hypothetical protein